MNYFQVQTKTIHQNLTFFQFVVVVIVAAAVVSICSKISPLPVVCNGHLWMLENLPHSVFCTVHRPTGPDQKDDVVTRQQRLVKVHKKQVEQLIDVRVIVIRAVYFDIRAMIRAAD